MTILTPRPDGSVSIKIICSRRKLPLVENTPSVDLRLLRDYLTGTLDSFSVDTASRDLVTIEGISTNVLLYGWPVEYETTICPG